LEVESPGRRSWKLRRGASGKKEQDESSKNKAPRSREAPNSKLQNAASRTDVVASGEIIGRMVS